jgi:general secretion pathway protein F
MSVMLSAGISIVDALEFYTSTLPSKGLKAVLLQVQESLKSGDSPNVAFSRTKAFSPLFVGLVTAGAASGDLGSALRSLAKQLELQLQLKSKIRKIVMLPSVVITLLFGIFLAAQLVVTPKIENMLTANGVAPDAFSKVIFQMAKITEAIWVPVVLAVIAAVVTVALSPKVREFILNVGMSRLRSVREVVMGVRQTTFVGTLSMLQNSGIVMEEALGITAGVMSGTPMGREVEEVRNQYLTGLDVSKCVRQFTSCDPTVVHMIAIGEKTGQLPEQLTLCAGMVEDQTKDAMDILSSRVQTMSTVIPVVLIAFIFVSSYLPIVMMSAQMMKSID